MGIATITNAVLLFMVITSTAANQHISPDDMLARPNYGVIFRPLKPIHIVTDEWNHVFVIQLPDRCRDSGHIERLRNFNCSKIQGLTETSCRSFQPLLDSLVMLHETALRKVSATIEHMYQILPNTMNFRRPRGLFDLGGKILNSLFGVATTEQLDALRNAKQSTQ